MGVAVSELPDDHDRQVGSAVDYLLGYYSTNTKADGSFRKITVRVKRQGVAMRARRGYLAATASEVAARKAAERAVEPEVVSRDTALATLGAIRADRPFHAAAGVAWQAVAGQDARPIVWVTGELDLTTTRDMTWAGGADASIALLTADGRSVASKQVALPTAGRGLVEYLPADLKPGQYLVRVNVQGKAGGGGEASEQMRLAVPQPRATGASPLLGQALLFRRGPFSGPGFQPTADLRFRRAERVRVDVPLSGPVDSVSARVLDRRGEPLAVPASALPREDNGLRLASVEVNLAPFAAGDYLIEVSAKRGDGQENALVAIRIVP